ncbi:hypothetical protein Tco_0336805 [Tanacetum coccineum]
MEVPDAMISDVIKKKAGYMYYMAKKMESEKAKIIDELKEQHVSLVKTRRGKGFMCYADQVANVPNKLKKDVVPRKTRSLTIVEEAVVGELANSIIIQEPRSQRRRRSQLTIDSQTDEAVADMYNEWGQKLKGPAVEDPAVQSLLDLQKGSKASKLKSLRKKKQPVAGEGSSAAHNKYYSPSDSVSDVTLYSFSSDNSKESTNENDDAYESNMDLFDDNPHRDNDDASASEVPLGTHVDVLATTTLMQEMFSEENAHHILSLPGISKENSLFYNNSPTKIPTSQSKESDAKGEK